ncbi:MAG: hypothetical protein M3361_08305 [Candidatus Tectomicrobia bacterium]|nr:hypothetical protein [Candidatus Tectomicrobia bacterium]
MKPFEEYGLRFDSDASFFDEKSNGFQLESSLLRSVEALERLCGVLAIMTLERVSPGIAVVNQGKRRGVDAHGVRGSRYLQIGWNWVQRALSSGYELVTRLSLSAEADPEPAMASTSQYQQHPRPFFALEFQDAVA